jgi:hypothetical protein
MIAKLLLLTTGLSLIAACADAQRSSLRQPPPPKPQMIAVFCSQDVKDIVPLEVCQGFLDGLRDWLKDIPVGEQPKRVVEKCVEVLNEENELETSCPKGASADLTVTLYEDYDAEQNDRLWTGVDGDSMPMGQTLLQVDRDPVECSPDESQNCATQIGERILLAREFARKACTEERIIVFGDGKHMQQFCQRHGLTWGTGSKPPGGPKGR